MKIVNSIEEANYITHSGTMHADEVFATAFLDMLFEDIKVFRTNNINENDYKDKLIYDIGKGKFDHHQEDARIRDNKIKYCSFGLLFEEYGKDLLEKLNIDHIDDVYNEIVKDLVEQIDAIDNGEFPRIEANYKVKTLSDTFKLFNPSYKSNEKEYIQFEKAVSVAKILLEEEILSARGKMIAKSIVLEKVKNTDKNYIILDEYMPYEDTIINTEDANNIYYVIYPATRGGYALKTIPKGPSDRSSRMDIPKNWAGKSDEDLVKETNINDLTFCHTGRFLICSKTLNGLEEAVNKMIELNNVENNK